MTPRRARVRSPLALVLALGALAAGCITQEWTPMRDEAEMISLANARRICDDWAEREATSFVPLGTRMPGERDRVDRAEYNRLFRRCMRHHGWELRPREQEAESADPAS